jgi:hypothetical protein
MGTLTREPSSGRLLVAEHWRENLERNFSIFGQLVYLGSLRDAESGAFLHEGLELRCGKRRAQSLFENEYSRILNIWLGYDPARQEREIRMYFRVFENRRKSAVAGEKNHERGVTNISGRRPERIHSQMVLCSNMNT